MLLGALLNGAILTLLGTRQYTQPLQHSAWPAYTMSAQLL